VPDGNDFKSPAAYSIVDYALNLDGGASRYMKFKGHF